MSTRVEELFAQRSLAAPDCIVVATALTDLEYLTPTAIAQAQESHAELIFVHALVEDEPPAKAAYYNSLKAHRDARLALEVAARHVRTCGLGCTALVRHGAVRDVVGEVVQEKTAGRLIIGNRSRPQEKASALGQTARQLLTHQWIPVSCARPGQMGRHVGNGTPRRILYPVAGELEHGHLAHDLAKYFRADLLVPHEGSEERAAARILGHCAVNCPLGLKPSARWIATEKIEAKSIAETAHSNEINLIVLDGPALFDPERMFRLLEELLNIYYGEVLVG